jgi:tRNA(His) guanylyltransferase
MEVGMSDELGDRMKEYEGHEAGRRLLPLLPICVRIDGRGFSRFTHGLRRPFDPRLTSLMINVTTALVEESNAVVGYTQSDEISLVLYSDDRKSQTFLDRRVQKLTSILASFATGAFNARLAATIPEKAGAVATFDARVWSVPSLDEAANTLLWREMDASKNSISMAAREHFSPKEMHGKSGREMQAMLLGRGVNWNDYPEAFKRGTYVRRVITREPFTPDEIAGLPERHEARRDPSLVVERSRVSVLRLPRLGSVANRVDVLFRGADPIQHSDK